MTDTRTPTLYEWAGGRAALVRLFEAFYRTVLTDELLEPLFRDMDRGHPQHVADWLGEQYMRWLHPTSGRRPGETFL